MALLVGSPVAVTGSALKSIDPLMGTLFNSDELPLVKPPAMAPTWSKVRFQTPGTGSCQDRSTVCRLADWSWASVLCTSTGDWLGSIRKASTWYPGAPTVMWALTWVIPAGTENW